MLSSLHHKKVKLSLNILMLLAPNKYNDNYTNIGMEG